MPTITAPAESDRYNEDLTLLTLYSLAGEESSGFLAIRPHFIRHLGKVIFSEKTTPSAERMVEAVTVRERDSMTQERISLASVVDYLSTRLRG